ncbi:hypothetical protein [Kribbella sp. NPDC000426]|uniref:hypothetical protein n=1 Tax=Kribbella sp. NPDC000426 TaxID=3154255 RepID=UPI00331B2B50
MREGGGATFWCTRRSLPAGIFLYSSRTPDLGFDTTQQKAAWGAGHVTIAPGVKLGSGGTTRIEFGNGSSVSTSVLDPRPALTEAIGTPYDNCGHIHVPPSKCRLTITGASLTTAVVDTSSGRATVPAWSFTTQGKTRPIVVIAISQDVVKPVVQPVPPPGLPTPPPGLVGYERLTRTDGNTLTISLSHGACDTDLRAHAVEFDDMVIIGGTHAPTRTGAPCPLVLLNKTMTITLTKSLGNRAVISAATGTRLTPR